MPKPGHVRSVAAVGNTIALLAIGLACLLADALFTSRHFSMPAAEHAPSVRGSMVVLVVIDGFSSRGLTSEIMPGTHRLWARHGCTRAQGASLIPSTVVGIRALIEGTAVPPGAFVEDFRARSAQHGGVIEALSGAGLPVYAAGPTLWRDLYSRWLRDFFPVFGLAREDAYVERAVTQAIQQQHDGLIIAHFSAPDVAAHRFGGASAPYFKALSECDARIRRLLAELDDNALLIATGDHGVTRGGGHAGGEQDALETPLVVNRPEALAAHSSGVIYQTEIPHLIARQLGVSLPGDDVGQQTGSRWNALRWIGIALLVLAAAHVLSTIQQSAEPARCAFRLNVGVWLSLGLAGFSATAAALTSLLALAYSCPLRRLRSSRCLLLVGAGVVIGVARIADSLFADPLPAGGGTLILVLLGAFGVMSIAARLAASRGPQAWLWIGALFSLLAIVANRVCGETASLSTLDVRQAFYLIERYQNFLPGVLTAGVRPFAIALLILGAVALSPIIRTSGECLRYFSVGLGGIIAGQLAIAAATISIFRSPPEIPIGAAALGVFVRACADVLVLFPAIAAVAFFSGGFAQRKGDPRPT